MDASPFTEMSIVALWPARSVPDDGLTLSSPSRLDPSLTDQFTGPPSAVIVTAVPPSVLSTTVPVETDRVPGAGAEVGAGEVAGAVDGGAVDGGGEDPGDDG